MAGKQMGAGGAEAELNRLRTLEDAAIPRMSAVINAFTSLERALSAVRLSEHWKGSAAEAATADIDDIRLKVSAILETVKVVDTAIADGNSARREIAAAELPSATVDPFWANVAKGASVVVHPVLGPLAADTALDAIGDFLGNQREERARQIVQDVEASMVDPTTRLDAAAAELNTVDFVKSDSSNGGDSPSEGTPVDAPRLSSPSSWGGPSGYTPGGGYQPPTTAIGEYVPPTPTNPTPPTYPSLPDPGNWDYDPDGPDGSDGSDDPTVDFPGGGVLPGGPGTGILNPSIPGGSGLPGGGIGSGVGGGIGGGLGGIVGGGAGAAAIAAGSKISGIGSMGALRGAGLGGASGAGVRAGGGLLGGSGAGGGTGVRGVGGLGAGMGGSGVGGTGVGGTGVGGVGSAGGAGAGGAGSSGAAGSGMRPGMGMMGGAGGAEEEEKAKRSGLGGPIAPKLEDDEERGPRAKSAQAGSRDDHAG